MSSTNEYLVYSINLSNLAVITALQGSLIPVDGDPTVVGNGIGAILAAPDDAATKYGAPILAAHAPFVAPCITSKWFGTNDHFPTNEASFDRKSGGWFGWSWLFGDTTHYHWRGVFVYSPPAGPPGVPVPVNISHRRWLDGFELPDTGEGAVTGIQSTCSRDASRHVQGFGLALRPGNGPAVKTHLHVENGDAPPTKLWERYYLRLRQLPDAPTTFWRVRRSVSNACGAVFQMAPSGQIVVSTCSAVGTLTFVAAVGAFGDFLWHRIDLFINIGAPLQMWIDGTVVLTAAIADLPATFVLVSSEMGTVAAHTLGLDVDDWMGADQPASTDGVDFQNGSAMRLINPTGIATPGAWVGDYRSLQQVPPNNPTVTAAVTSSTAADTLVATTDAHAVISEAAQSLGCVAINVAVFVDNATMRAGAVLGLDTTDAGITGVKTGVLGTAGSWFHFLWSIGAVPTALKPTDPIRLTFTHGAAGATPIRALVAVAELLGAFGPEDTPHVVPKPKVPVHLGIHNAPYPDTPWATLSTPPEQPVYIKGGTYTGNGIGQDLAFPVPIHFLWIRPLTTDVGGVRWWSSNIGAHSGGAFQTKASLMVRAWLNANFVPTADMSIPAPPATLQAAIDLSNQMAYGRAYNDAAYAGWAPYLTDPAYFFGRMLGSGAQGGPDEAPFGAFAVPPSPWNVAQQQYLVSLAGGDGQNNATGIVYAYVAVGDPGMRYMLNGALRVNRGTADEITTLIHPTFTPQAGFFQWEDRNQPATEEMFYKGPGHAPSSLSPMNLAELANALTWGPGVNQLTNKSAFKSDCDQTSFSLWRIDDGSPGNAGKVVQILSYVGNGTASRSIALSPATGKRPLFALIVPHSGRSWFRDASHTTINSSQTDGAVLTTGITGGDIDTLLLGAALNTNAVVYDVFVIPGSTVAGNGGFSVPGEFIPVSPTPPPGAPTDSGGSAEPPDGPIADLPAEPPSGLPDPLAPIGPMPGLVDDLAPACEPDTRRMINLALSRIGISKQIADVALDRTREATAARLVYKEAIETTLRDFPWPFATRYAQLAVLNGGARPNTDWRYVYRQPSDCLFERRIVVSRTDVANPDGVPFQLSSDFDPGTSVETATGGGIIFTNLENAVLEYTARPKCPHTRSEPLFRDAAAWKLAEMMAPALSRMTDATVLCAKAYQGAVDQAYLVLRPGNAGDVPATATVDTAAAAQAANLAVANAALIQIGAKTIRNLTSDQSREAQLVRIVFEQELRATLRDYPWPFATVYVTPVLVAGTAAVGVNADWQYSYRLPADLVFARRLVTARRRTYEPNPSTFKVAQDATGGLLYTDVPTSTTQPMVLEYTNRPEGAVLVADALFRDALAWRLSWKLAPSLALLVPDRPEAVGRGPDESAEKTKERTATGATLRARAAATARECYYFSLALARVGAAKEAQIDIDPPDATWITDRE